MLEGISTPQRIRFGPFELDRRAGELRKHDLKIRLQEQPFQILLMLLERPGEVVLREEIRKRLWPHDTIVEFDHSINAAIKRLRDALGESAEEPRCVETVARRGYRFIGQVDPNGESSSSVNGEALTTAPTNTKRIRPWVAAALLFALMVTAGIVALRGLAESDSGFDPIRVTRFAGELADEQNPAFSPDGRSVAYLRIMPSTRELVVQSLESSTAVTLVSRPYLNSAPLWTRDGTRVCYRAGNEIWCVGAVGGTPQKLLADVLTADFTPDGASLLFFPESLAQPRQLFVSSPPGATPRSLEGMTFPKSVGPLPFVVSPDGTKLLVVTSSVIVTGVGSGDAWIVPYPLGVPMPLANPDHMQVVSARWLPDSRHVVLAEILPSAHSYRRIVIVDTQSANRRLIVQNTGISPSFAVSPDASRIIYSTGQPTDDIVEYSADGRRLRELAASPDPEINPVWAPSGDQFLYTVLKSGGDPSWWMRRADGSDAAVFAAHAVSGWPSYSPDGRRIAYATSSVASNTPGIETIPAQGGHPVRIVSSPAGERVCWSADGEWLWYYQNGKLWKVPSQGGQPVAIWDRDKTGPLLDCSADGRWIAYLFPNSVHLIAPDGTQDHVLTSLDGYTGFGQVGCFGPLGKNFYLLRNNFRALDVLDVATGKLRRTIEFDLAAADRIAWFSVSPDENRILAQTGGVRLDLWTAEGFALPAQGWKRWFMHWDIGRK